MKTLQLRKTVYLVVFLSIPAVLIGLIFLIAAGSVNVYDALFYFSSPLVKFFGFVGGTVDLAKDAIFDFNSLREEYGRLREENIALFSRLAGLNGLKEENEILKKQLGLKEPETAGKNLIFASVIGRSDHAEGKTLIIDKGAKSGAAKNDPFIYENFLAGRISEVYGDYSVVRTLEDSSSKISVIAQESRAEGILSFSGGIFVINDIAKNKSLNIGDIVATVGFEGLPKGLAVGVIEEIFNADNELFQSARVKPYFDFREIRAGFIVKN